jgi:tetratricopeptide (TPR) repeat protein
MTELQALEALRGDDPALAARAAETLWQMWHRSGDPRFDRLLRDGIDAMERNELSEAEVAFTRLIEEAPDFAEGWNKRATVHYLAGDYRKSLADCAEVVKRNPAHFGALSGYGQVYFQLEEYEHAISWWKRALEVNPNMTGVEINIKGTEELLKKKRGRAI